MDTVRFAVSTLVATPCIKLKEPFGYPSNNSGILTNSLSCGNMLSDSKARGLACRQKASEEALKNFDTKAVEEGD